MRVESELQTQLAAMDEKLADEQLLGQQLVQLRLARHVGARPKPERWLKEEITKLLPWAMSQVNPARREKFPPTDSNLAHWKAQDEYLAALQAADADPSLQLTVEELLAEKRAERDELLRRHEEVIAELNATLLEYPPELTGKHGLFIDGVAAVYWESEADFESVRAVSFSDAFKLGHRVEGKDVWIFEGLPYSAKEPLTASEATTLIRALLQKRARTIQRAETQIAVASASPGGSRQAIPDDVKIFVWQRDGGVCVRCGSNENLEFDHVIPVSMGGSDTARNLQILCEPCNRAKGGNLV